MPVTTSCRLCELSELLRFAKDGFCAFCLGQALDKTQQCSRWDLRPFSDQQLKYAALDAWILLALLGHIIKACHILPRFTGGSMRQPAEVSMSSARSYVFCLCGGKGTEGSQEELVPNMKGCFIDFIGQRLPLVFTHFLVVSAILFPLCQLVASILGPFFPHHCPNHGHHSHLHPHPPIPRPPPHNPRHQHSRSLHVPLSLFVLVFATHLRLMVLLAFLYVFVSTCPINSSII